MGTGSAALVGRLDELASLRAAAHALANKTGRVVLLEGEAGGGKTRLVEELAPAAVAGALEYAGAPYAPIRDLLRALQARAPRVLERDPELAESLRPVLELEPAQGRRQVLDAVVKALTKYAGTSGLVVAVDDLHWIDGASADVLVHLARTIARLPILLVLTYRAAEAAQRDESRALIANLTRSATATITLRSLSDAESMLLIQEASIIALPLELRRSICEMAQGNPLLLLESTRHANAGPASGISSLPMSLQALVHDRLSHFDRSEREVLGVCAAMEVFDHVLVAEIAQISEEPLIKTLRKARDLGLIGESGSRFVFRHALIRRAIADDLLALERSALHSRIARRLEKSSEVRGLNARLAYHYWMAGESRNAERYNRMCARDAMAVYAFDDAAVFFERAIGGRDMNEDVFELYEEARTGVRARGAPQQRDVALPPARCLFASQSRSRADGAIVHQSLARVFSSARRRRQHCSGQRGIRPCGTARQRRVAF